MFQFIEIKNTKQP